MNLDLDQTATDSADELLKRCRHRGWSCDVQCTQALELIFDEDEVQSSYRCSAEAFDGRGKTARVQGVDSAVKALSAAMDTLFVVTGRRTR